ncbi:4-hydroxythreonine-4-phosphate dehydrogenase [Caldalkalibacillus uzonensis]|uniref:4-hydroxythreonine-4-phosphate dehydrogenase n=1 Tax=Caldalkalibacillus uzonensis TaxID=353224 RepID=A0ABU0CP53_9BACI|nr:4-hydroxythreonine-4-phosphate dehydrogenase PdxA [Caldalkalibacillus uzonensis]MDQ0338195.1 4-hydroxythreonine-4-phosphate dehydrogenase [Caldalkalibacillus uzonensis]
MSRHNKPTMGLTLGEAPGIGPELVVKALQDDEIKALATWVIIGDERVLHQGEAIAKLSLPYQKASSIDEVNDSHPVWLIDLGNLDPQSYELGVLSIHSGKITGETLIFALELAKTQKLDGVVYAPLNKEALHKGGFHFQDEIHFFADLLNCQEGFGEINVMDTLWVTRVTSHVPLKEVSALVTKENVLKTIQFADENLRKAGYQKPKICVAALNPHAGDGGLLGTEEIEEIIPAVEEAKDKGIEVNGPFPADTILLRRDTDPFDCLVGMYHDQAQIGMKLLGFNRGVTISGGLPVVLTTPAHGTAFDIAGQGIADPQPMKVAMKLGVRLSQNLN